MMMTTEQSILNKLEELARSAWDLRARAALRGSVASSDFESSMLVYADALQQMGDIRGELIARDLGSRDAASTALEYQWLGNAIAGHHAVKSKFGLLGLSVGSHDTGIVQEICTSPPGRFLENVVIVGTSVFLESILRLLSIVERPWLGRLRLVAVRRHGSISDEIWRSFITSAPNLHTFEIAASTALLNYAHPNALRIVVDGLEALGSISTDVAPACSAVELSVAFVSQYHDAASTERFQPNDTFVTSKQFPELARLSMERNEPGWAPAFHLGGENDAYRLLEHVGVLGQLTHLRMPYLRRQSQVDSLRRAHEKMKKLVEFQIAKSYVEFKPSIGALKIPQPMPWPPRDEIEHSFSVALVINQRSSRPAPVSELANVLERHPIVFAGKNRTAWKSVWRSIEATFTAGRAHVDPEAMKAVVSESSTFVADDGWKSVVSLVEWSLQQETGSVWELVNADWQREHSVPS